MTATVPMNKLRARAAAIAASPEAARCRAIVERARELREELESLLAEVKPNAAAAILQAAGLDDPGNADRFGGWTFADTLARAATLREALAEFVGMCGSAVPSPAESRG